MRMAIRLASCLAALVLVLAGGVGRAQAEVTATIDWTQRLALTSLYKAMNGDQWKPECRAGFKTPPLDSDGFAMPGTEATWGGEGRTKWLPIRVDNTEWRRFLNIVDFSDCGLKGSFLDGIGGPIPFLVNIPYVWQLSLSKNEIGGRIPDEIVMATSLQFLGLSKNKFSGNVPRAFFEHPELRALFLDGNEFTGFETPTTVNPKLESMTLGNNRFDCPIPEFFGSLVQMKHLNLAGHGFTGPIPSSLGGMTSLERLDLKSNRLTGPIPVELLALPKVALIDLSDNQLTGPLPTPNLGAVPALPSRQIRLNHNQIDGTLPAEWLSLPGVYQLDLANNLLSGALPAPAAQNEWLTGLNLQRNALSGSLPAAWDQFLVLRSLDLSENRFEGTVPQGICALSSVLKTLNLHGNALTAVSDAPGCLGTGVSLSLSRNAIAHEMPANLAEYVIDKLQAAPSSWTPVDWNGLFPGPAQADAFQTVIPNWREKQTLSPDGPSVQVLGSRAVRVSWTPVQWPELPGQYRISLTSKGGIGNAERITVNTVDLENATWLVSGLTPERTYEVRVRTVTLPHALNSNAVVSFGGPTLEVTMPEASDEAGMAANPDRLTFVAYPSLPQPPAQEVAILGTSGGEPRWRVTPQSEWVTVSPEFGRGDALLTVSVSPDDKPGILTTTIQIGPDLGLPGDTFQIPVTVIVLDEDPTALTPQPATLSFQGIAGGHAPQAQPIALVAGRKGLEWNVIVEEDWLRADPVEGSEHGLVFVDVNPMGRTAGTYEGTVVFVRDGIVAKELARVPVTMTLAAPQVAATPTSLHLTVGTEDQVPATANLAISFASEQGIPWRLEPAGSIALALSLPTGIGDGNCVVGVEFGELPPGDHTGELRLFAPPDETEPTVVVPVTVTVQEGIVVVPDTSEEVSEGVGGDEGGSVSEDVADSGPRPDAWQEDPGTGSADVVGLDQGHATADVPAQGKSKGGCTTGSTAATVWAPMLLLALLPALRRRTSRSNRPIA